MSKRAKICRFCRNADGELIPERFDAAGEVYRYRQRMDGQITGYHHASCLEEREVIEAASRRRQRIEDLREAIEVAGELGRAPLAKWTEELAELEAQR